ncbi:selenide, water dikinase SelD [Telmatobacter sp. DSM 110680]|uniref:Selenide, water dikinase n=1 Tax=Telmatobacter sp. DSM 110680 TaxID=3036704 RepID=A0AAU7DPH4_9BACT
MTLEPHQPIRLTQQVKAGGCASKLPAGSLRQVLSALPAQTSPDLVVGFETSDDAGIFRIGPKQALVQTIDFFTPLVDDPFTFGQIAATNALSDVYAMGGRPLTALAVVCFPQDSDLGILEQIMRGGLSKMSEANCIVVGGHSVRDVEMKFGYAVTGLIDPERVYTNAGAVPGDTLILTKPIGTGVITTALKQGKSEAVWVDHAIRSMTTLNGTASALAIACSGVHAITDITGFGLMGHAREMALGSGVTLEIETAHLPLLDGALSAVRLEAIPGGLLANRDFAECLVQDSVGSQIPDDLRALLYDPQTSGGLLISVARENAPGLLASFQREGVPAAVIGCVSGASTPGAHAPAIILR